MQNWRMWLKILRISTVMSLPGRPVAHRLKHLWEWAQGQWRARTVPSPGAGRRIHSTPGESPCSAEALLQAWRALHLAHSQRRGPPQSQPEEPSPECWHTTWSCRSAEWIVNGIVKFPRSLSEGAMLKNISCSSTSHLSQLRWSLSGVLRQLYLGLCKSKPL